MTIPGSLRRCLPYAAVLAGAYLLFRFCLPYVLPFAVGFLLSLLFRPFVELSTTRLGLPRWLGAALALTLLALLLGLAASALARRLLAEAVAFQARLPAYLTALEGWLARAEAAVERLTGGLPSALRPQSDFSLARLWSSLLGRLTKAENPFLPLDVLLALPGLCLNLIFTLLSAFFFTTDHDALVGALRRALPPELTRGYRRATAGLTAALWGFAKAQLIIMAFIFGLCLVGFLLLHSPYAFWLALLTAFVDALPFFGSGAVLWPAALLALLSGRGPLALGYLVLYLLISLVRQLLQPRILGSQIGLSPLAALFSMFLGWKLLGVVGFVAGPLTAVVLKCLPPPKS